MALGQTNENYEPTFDWLQDSESHTLYLNLPGFKKEQLKVQITSTRILKVSGERKTNENKLVKFHKEFPIPNDADTTGIRAKFESGILYIRLPKSNTKIQEESPKKPQQQEHKQEQKEEQKEYYDENKRHQLKDKGKIDEEKLEDDKKYYYGNYKDNTNVSGEGTSSKGELGNNDDSNKGIMEKRTPTFELVSRQSQEYKNAVYGLVKQRKLVNLVVVLLSVLVFVIYVNNAIKSYFGGSKSQEL